MRIVSLDPVSRLAGEVSLPGDKSISHRSAMLASLCDGEVEITNYSPSADCAATLDCLDMLGIDVDRADDKVRVSGKGMSGLAAPRETLDCGNSGTTMRLMAGILAGQPFESTLSGDASLNGRPMQRVIDPISQMGAQVRSEGQKAPLNIVGKRPLNAIRYQPPVASAQIKSCVLLAGLFSDGDTTVIEKVRTRDHTERMLRWLGVDVRERADDGPNTISVTGGSHLTARDLVVPGDISAASFFMVAAACLDGSDVTFSGVGYNPSRAGIVDVLRTLGVTIDIFNERERCNEPVADMRVKGGIADASGERVLSGAVVANMIDELPVIAVLGTQLPGGIEVRDAGELRVKETDRIAAVTANLRAMGADIDDRPDGFVVRPSKLRGADVRSFDDHRIAMAFAIAALIADGETRIQGAECVSVSFPSFFDTLAGVSI